MATGSIVIDNELVMKLTLTTTRFCHTAVASVFWKQLFGARLSQNLLLDGHVHSRAQGDYKNCIYCSLHQVHPITANEPAERRDDSIYTWYIGSLKNAHIVAKDLFGTWSILAKQTSQSSIERTAAISGERSKIC